MPDDLCTVEALADVRRVLRPGGVYVANLIDEAPLRRARRQVATVAEVFGPVTLIAERAVLGGAGPGTSWLPPGAHLREDAHWPGGQGGDVLEGDAAALGAAAPALCATKSSTIHSGTTRRTRETCTILRHSERARRAARHFRSTRTVRSDAAFLAPKGATSRPSTRCIVAKATESA